MYDTKESSFLPLVLLRCSSKLPIQFYFKGEKESLEDDAKCFEFQHICIAGQAEKKLRIFSMFMTFAKFSLPWHQILWYGWHDLNCYARISMHFPYNNFFGLTNSDRKQNENRIKLLSSLVVFSKWHNITSVSTLFSPFIFYCSRLAVASGVINVIERNKLLASMMQQ